LYKNAVGGRATPGHTGRAIALPRPLAIIRGTGGGKGKERVGNWEGEEGGEGVKG